MKGNQIQYSLAVLSLILLFTSCSKSTGEPLAVPIIDSIAPKYTENGKEIYLHIKNLSSNQKDNKVSIGGIEVNALPITARVLRATVPQNTFDQGRLSAELKINCVGKTTSALIYSILYPRISSFSPEKVSPGQILTIKGLNFVEDKSRTQVFFERLAGSSISAEIVYIDTEKVRVKVPENASSGTLYMLVKLTDGPSSVLIVLPDKKITVL